jgi:trimeric autotransporter adhesin
MKRTRLKISALMILLVALAGCGGGGGSGSNAAPTTPPSAPTVTLAVGIKQLQFSWNAVSGATHYQLFEDPDGVSGFTQVGGNITGTSAARDIVVHRHNWGSARYRVQACNSLGCTGSNDVVTLGATLQAIGYLKSSNPDVGDWFGVSIALSSDGRTLAVGAPGEASSQSGINNLVGQADNSAPAAGAVYVYVRNGNGTWAQQAYIKASNPNAQDGFGVRVALSDDGNTLAVGADGEDGPSNATDDVGAVYIFVRGGSTWTQQAILRSANAETGDLFGAGLAISGDGNTVAVGAIGEDSDADGIDGDESDNTAESAGAVYVFTRTGTTWTRQAYVKASNSGQDDRFGAAVALNSDGNTLVVGAPREDGADDGSTDNAGAAYVFTRTAGVWAQQAYVKASNAGAGDRFGSTTALSDDGNTLAVGAIAEASSATGINGDENDNSASGAGAAYVYTRSGVIWTQQAYIKASNTNAGDDFGWSIALSGDGNTLVVGADEEDSGAVGIDGDQEDNSFSSAGAVYVYTRSGGTWSQQAYLKAPNTGQGDYFGDSVAVSYDGSTIAVGAQGEASNAAGIGGDQTDNSLNFAGAAYLY